MTLSCPRPPVGAGGFRFSRFRCIYCVGTDQGRLRALIYQAIED